MTERTARRLVPILTTLGVLSALITGVATNLVADWISLDRPTVIAILLVSTLIALVTAVRLQQPAAAADTPGAEPPARMKGYRRNPFFVGRDAELAKLHALTGPVVVTGMGGIGKTQLVVEFADRYRAEFAGGVFWLDFEDERSALAEIAACGEVDGFRLYLKDEKLTLEERAALVRREWEKPVRRLLIFDNCEDPELLQRHRPAGGGCRIIVTSRDGFWDAWLGVTTFPLDLLDRGQSVALIRAFREEPEPDDPALAEICAELGDLPLALHMAGRFLQEHRGLLQPAEYLAELRAAEPVDHPSLDEDRLPTPTRHVSALGRTFRLSHGRLDPANEVDAVARTMLVHAALLAPGQPIPAPLLIACTAPASANRARRAAARLVALGLLDRPGNAADVFRVHRLTASFARRTADDLAAARRDVERGIVEAIRQPNRSGHPQRILGLHPHLQWVTGPDLDRADAPGAALYHERGRALYVLGAFAEAKGYLRRALEIRRAVLDEHDPDLAMTLLYLGIPLYYTGEYDEARALLTQALEIRRQLPGGESDGETAWILNFLGNVCSHTLDREGAFDFHQRALTIWLARADDADQENSLHAVAVGQLNTGADLARLGRPIEGLRRVEAAQRLFVRPEIDNEHFDALLGGMRLAELRADLFEYETANRLIEAQLTRALQRHASYIELLGWSGIIKAIMWRLDEAHEALARTIELSRNAYSETHTQTIRWANELAGVLRRSGRSDEALAIYRRITADTTGTSFGARLLLGYGQALVDIERFTEGAAILARATAAAQAITGAEAMTARIQLAHVQALTLWSTPRSLATAEDLLAEIAGPPDDRSLLARALLCRARRDHPASMAFLRTAVELVRAEHPERQVTLADLLIRLAEAERDGRRLAAAGEHLAEARTLLPDQPEHPLLLPVRAAEVVLDVARGDLAGAELRAGALARWYADRVPPDHPDLLLHRYPLAVIQSKRGKAGPARAAVTDYLEHLGRRFGDRHGSRVEPLAVLGGIHRRLGNVATADGLVREAIELAAARWPDGHEIRIRLIAELAAIRIRAGRPADVPALVDDGFRLAATIPGPAEELTAPLLAMRGEAFRALGEFDQAANDLGQASEQGAVIWTTGHPELAVIRGRLGAVRREIGLLISALEVLERQMPGASETRELRRALRVTRR